MTLKKKALSGVKWSSAASLTTAIVQLSQVAILARFLDKEDFGLMAIALFVLGISQIFLDMGISNSVIFLEKVSNLELDTLFWTNIIMGTIIYSVLYFLTPTISNLYEAPQLNEIISGVSLTFLILPFGQLYEALLKKQLQFKALAIRDMSSKIIGLAVSIILAMKGYGVFSLVFGNISTVLISTILLVANGQKIYKPSFKFSLKAVHQQGLLSFGLFQMGEKIMNYFNSQFDTLIIGKLLGMESLGMYNIAKTLAFKPYQFINPILTNVSFPVLARLKTDTEKLKTAYLAVLQALSTTNAPIYTVMMIWADPLIELVFGKEWLMVTPVFRLLCVSAFCNSIGNPVGSLQLAKGRADLGFYWNLGMLIFLPVTIWFGSRWGLMGVSLSLTIYKILVLFPAWRLFVYPLCKASAQEYFWSFGKPILITMLAAAIGATLVISFFSQDTLISLILGTICIVLVVGGLHFKLNKNLIAFYTSITKI